MKTLILAVLSSAIFMSACADPAANKPKAQVSQPAAAAATSAENMPVGTSLTFGPETSTIGFVGSKVTGKHDGGFKKFHGVIDLVGDKAEASKVLVNIDMASVYADADGLTEHLQTGDFFDVAKFPTASFNSTSITPDAAKGVNNFTVTGDLEMRGVKKFVTFPATITVTPDDVAVKSEFSINRKDFGIVYAGKADDLIRDDVVLLLDIKALRK